MCKSGVLVVKIKVVTHSNLNSQIFLFFTQLLPWPVARELMSQMSLLYISGIYAYLRNSEPTVNIILLNRVVLYVFQIIVQIINDLNSISKVGRLI